MDVPTVYGYSSKLDLENFFNNFKPSDNLEKNTDSSPLKYLVALIASLELEKKLMT